VDAAAKWCIEVFHLEKIIMEIIEVPIFPLPNIVFFPKIILPLHIFEPRYRRMVVDVLEGERIIGMVLLQQGWEKDYEGTPLVFPVGCMGRMEAHERAEQGSYNILLRGMSRFEIVEFVQDRPYRKARVRLLADVPLSMAMAEEVRERNRFLELFERYLAEVMGVELEKDMLERTGSLEIVVNQVAASLDIPVMDKQLLLQIAAVSDRYARLRAIIDERLRMAHQLQQYTISPDDPSLN
jgi:hypothetical protein